MKIHSLVLSIAIPKKASQLALARLFTPIMTQKLQKILAGWGAGSRRQLEQQIVAGQVRVNGQVAQLGDRITGTEVITLAGCRLAPSSGVAAQMIMYHKPVGRVCTRQDTHGRPTVFDQLPRPKAGRWVMVGRLDINTSGLLLFSTDGDLAHQLAHPSSDIARTYVVRVFGYVSPAMIARLQKGVRLKDGVGRFESIKPIAIGTKNPRYEVSVRMGKNRIVRRLWESQGVRVNRLARIAFGKLRLPHTLKAGDYLTLNPGQVLAQCGGSPHLQ